MKYILGPIKLSFLVLGPVCMFLGLAVAVWTNGSVNAWYTVLAFVGGICAHISVNALNEYSDIKSGLDLRTTRTPFSGGSGALAEDPTKAPYALWTGLISAMITAAIGIFFAAVYGWIILLIGIVGLFVIFIYTNYLNKNPFLCLVSPGFGFGTLMVLGTFYVLTGTITWTAVLASFIPFWLVNDLLLLNQFPDAEADKTVGRRHLPIVYGKKVSAIVFSIFYALAFIFIVMGVILHLTPAWTMLALAALILAIPTAKNVLANAENLPALLPSLAKNVMINLITPVLMGIGFLIK